MTNSDRYVGVREEATFGTEASVPMAFDLTDGMGSCSIDVPDDPNITIPTLSRFQKRHVPGFYNPSGDLDYSADVNTLGWFLKWVLGGYKYTAGTGENPNKHEFYAMVGSELKSFTTRVGKDTWEHIIMGCVINKLSLNIDNELLTGKISVIAQKDKLGTIRTTLNEPDQDIFPLAFYNHTIKMDTVDVSSDVKSVGLDFDNGIKAEDGQGQGSRFPYLFRAGDGKLDLSIKMNDDSSDRIKEFWGGETGPTTDPHTPFTVEEDYDSGDFGSMNILYPRCYYTKAPSDIKGSEPRTPEYGVGAESTSITLDDGITVVDSPIVITILNFEDEYALPSIAPVAAFTGTPVTGVHPKTVSFTNTTEGAGVSYLWDFGDESEGSVVKNPVHTYAAAGTYTVVLTATNAAGEDIESKTDYITLT